MLAVPLQEVRMWAVRCPARRKSATRLVDDRSYPIQIVCLARDQYFQIIREADETTIKHPVCGARKSNPIADDVRPVCLDGAYVSRRDLRTPHSINELEACNCATLIVGAEDDTTENAIAQNSRYRHPDAVALLLNREWHLRLVVKIERLEVAVAPRQQRHVLREAKLAYPIEIVGRDRADCD